MRIILDARKNVEKNAETYFEKAKKAKKKAEGARKALEKTKERLAKRPAAREERRKTEDRKKQWYEKFRWFISSEGLLCIAGKDATSNETVVKKHTRPGDLVFHTDMSGSPFCVVKADGNPVGEETKGEAAVFTASHSRAWRAGLTTLDVFYVAPEQVTKSAESGEFMGKGAFMIRGDTTYLRPELKLLVGRMPDGRVMVGPKQAVLTHCGMGYEILQGRDKTSDVAKRLAGLLDVHPDEIIRGLPAGGVRLGRRLHDEQDGAGQE